MLDFVLEGERRNDSTTHLKAISITLLLIKLSGVRTSDVSLIETAFDEKLLKAVFLLYRIRVSKATLKST
jgi:hypothetical protein